MEKWENSSLSYNYKNEDGDNMWMFCYGDYIKNYTSDDIEVILNQLGQLGWQPWYGTAGNKIIRLKRKIQSVKVKDILPK